MGGQVEEEETVRGVVSDRQMTSQLWTTVALPINSCLNIIVTSTYNIHREKLHDQSVCIRSIAMNLTLK
jgi:hypothetical protein